MRDKRRNLNETTHGRPSKGSMPVFSEIICALRSGVPCTTTALISVAQSETVLMHFCAGKTILCYFGSSRHVSFRPAVIKKKAGRRRWLTSTQPKSIPQLPVRVPQQGALLRCAGCSSTQRAVAQCEAEPATLRRPPPPRVQLGYKSWDGEHPSRGSNLPPPNSPNEQTPLGVPRCLTAGSAPAPEAHGCAFVMLQRAYRGKGDILDPNIFLAAKVAYLAFNMWPFAASRDRAVSLPGSSFWRTAASRPRCSQLPIHHPFPIANERGRQRNHRLAGRLPSFLVLMLPLLL